MSERISIEGLSKAAVLAALCNGAKPQGMGFLHYTPETMQETEAAKLLERITSFDYLKGRVMKVDLSGDTFSPALYDRDNGTGAAARIISALRATNDVNPEEAELQHLEGTRNAAKVLKEHLHDEPMTDIRGDLVIVGLGFKDHAPELEEALKGVLDDE